MGSLFPTCAILYKRLPNLTPTIAGFVILYMGIIGFLILYMGINGFSSLDMGMLGSLILKRSEKGYIDNMVQDNVNRLRVLAY